MPKKTEDTKVKNVDAETAITVKPETSVVEQAKARDLEALPSERILLDLTAETLLLEDTGVSRLARYGVAALGLVIVGFFAFASLAQIEEAAKASGTITPDGQPQVVQHLEGGVVSDILVADGERVREGQIIAMLKADVAEVQLQELTQQEASLMLQEERLRAYLEDREPNFADIPEQFQGLAADQAFGFATQSETRLRKEAVAKAEVAQSRANLARVEGELAIARQQVALIDEELTAKQKLLAQGYYTQSKLMAVRSQRNEAQAEVLRLNGETARLKANITANQNRLAEGDSLLKEKAVADLQAVGRELRGVRESLARAMDRGERLDIAAPTAGFVSGLTLNTIGQIIKPGETVAEIVPTSRNLLVEARIPVAQIGKINTGQPASVKVTAYNVAQYGAVDGTITDISPDSFVDERTGEAFYKAKIALAQAFVGESEAANPLLPGMAVQADVNIGAKSLLAYLFKPVHAIVTNSFRES